MIKLNAGFLKNFFSHSRSERRGLIALLIILLIVIIIPAFLPEKSFDNSKLADLKAQVDEFENRLSKQIEEENNSKLFVFDPNTTDSIDFCRMGFSPAQTAVIIRYRNRGGEFRTANDFGQVYVVSDSVFNKLKPYINIEKKSILPQFTELNTADSVDLVKLSGIGSYYAKQIISRREKLGGFTSAEQLLEIYGIDSVRYNQFKHQIKVDKSKIQKINLNAVTATQLRQHPYFDTYMASGIIKFRKSKGGVKSLTELISEGIMTEQQAEKIKTYVIFE